MRVVVDTNVLVSALLAPQGTAGEIMRQLVRSEKAVLIISPETMHELRRVLAYPKIEKLLRFDPGAIERFVSAIEMLGEEVEERISPELPECRDLDDVKFLKLAVSGRADCLITGDQDLLVLKSVADIPIVTPAEFILLHPHP